MYTASDLRKGLKILIDEQPWIITEFDFAKPGKGQAIYNCKLKNMLNGSTMSRSYRSGDRFDKPELENVTVHYSYEDGANYVFTDENFEEIRVSADTLGDSRFFLMDDMECEALLFRGTVIEVTLPNFVERKVEKCDPGVRGNTASGKVTKPATLEGGYELAVPLFVTEGDTIRVDTRTGEYVDRVKSF
ncbi:MAG: elongation factor P [Kiritimatiellae bacterium]|jgi:elongation factor P|nr:elongation factor P [Kiritimatiellia bacterium]MBR4612142.1 elongation factor P [Kiritimatiellia bacterium]